MAEIKTREPSASAGAPAPKPLGEAVAKITMLPGVPRALFSREKRKPKRDRHARRRVAFMRFSYYEPAFKYFVERVLDADFVELPPATRRTVQLGSEQSCDYVCAPFKHILGDFIEALEHDADVLVQFTGFCRLNYYGELQETILRDMGYDDFDMLNFSYVPDGRFRDYVKYCKKVVNPDLSVPHAVANLYGTYKMAEHLDEFHAYYLANAGFEVEPGSFDRVNARFLAAMDAATTNAEVEEGFRRNMDAMRALPVDKPARPVRIGIIGDYYTAQDPASNLGVEKKLLAMGVELDCAMSISSRNLHYSEGNLRASIADYVENDMGPTSSLNIAAAKRYAEEGYDGVVHMKASGCTPEIDVMPVLQRISRDFHMPVLFLSFDTQTSDTGLDTRLEAFYDMVAMRKVRS